MSFATKPGSARFAETALAQRVHLLVLCLATGLPLLLFAVTGRYDLSLMDEGFLWYGAQRVRAGEVPQLDFQSYDIGRYYWSAFWMWLAGSDGIVPVRAGNAVLGSISVAIAVGLVRAGSPEARWRLVATAVLVAAWMVPDYKNADSFAALLLVAGLAGWLARPHDWRRGLIYGVCLGVASTIGMNHALYGTIAICLAILWHRWASRGLLEGRVFAALASGTVVGYLPVLVCHLAVDGFSTAFADSIRHLLDAGTTNLPLPPPRLTAAFGDLGSDIGSAVRESFLAAWLIVAALLWTRGVANVMRGPRPNNQASSPVLCAALIVCLPYAHYALSRLDMVHVAVGVPPLLIAVFTHPRVRFGSAAAPAGMLWIALASAVLLPYEHRGYRAIRGIPHQTIDLQGERLHVSTDTAAEISWLHGLTRAHAGSDQPFFAAPYWPGAYAAMRRPSPAWEIYALFPSPPYRQQLEIDRLAAAKIGFAVVSGRSIDQRADLGFAQTHPRIAAYLRNCFVLLPPSQSAPAGIQTFLPQRAGEEALKNDYQTQDYPCQRTTPNLPPPG